MDEERARATRLQEDNKRLTQRLQYLQASKTTPAWTEDIEARYASPVDVFHERQQEQKVLALPASERVVVRSGFLLLASPVGRRFLLVYAFSLHFLVFLVLYYLEHRHCA